MPENRETCFVIMPFSKTTKKHTEEYWSDQFNTFLKPLIEENPYLEARRSEALRGDILQQIITSLVFARVVVADLTDQNCNVYWELGIRQSFKHCTVTIAQFGTNLPFDLSGKGTLWYYPNNHLKMQQFREAFKAAIDDCLKNPNAPDSRVLDTLGGRGTLFEIFRRDDAIRRLDAVLSELNTNKALLNLMIKTAKRNIEIGDKKLRETIITSPSPLGTTAISLLIAERYVEEGASFFNEIERYHRSNQFLNGLIEHWHAEPVKVSKVLIENEETSRKRTEDTISLVSKARDKLSKHF